MRDDNEQLEVGDRRFFGPEDQPFETRDGILALTLYLCGYQFYCVNCYTADLLRNLGYKGMTMPEAAMQAVKDGKKGKLRYIFEKYPRTEHQNFYTEQEKQFEDDERRDAREVFFELLERFKAGEMPRDELVMRMGCFLFKTRIEFMNKWKGEVPMLHIANPGRTTHVSDGRGGGTYTSPGFVEVLANASQETFKKLGL